MEVTSFEQREIPIDLDNSSRKVQDASNLVLSPHEEKEHQQLINTREIHDSYPMVSEIENEDAFFKPAEAWEIEKIHKEFALENLQPNTARQYLDQIKQQVPT